MTYDGVAGAAPDVDVWDEARYTLGTDDKSSYDFITPVTKNASQCPPSRGLSKYYESVSEPIRNEYEAAYSGNFSEKEDTEFDVVYELADPGSQRLKDNMIARAHSF